MKKAYASAWEDDFHLTSDDSLLIICPYAIDTPSVRVLPDGHHVSRTSDFIIYSVEAEYLEAIVAQYGPCAPSPSFAIFERRRLALTARNLATKVGAVVAGQTSVKAPEQKAFEKHLPDDVHIVSCHSLHGPTISPLGQPLVRM
jgi:prephenate dehydrogenase (NADP+)